MVWDGPHGNLKRIAIARDSAWLASVIPGPTLSWTSEIPFDGRVEDDGTIELVTDRGTNTGGRYWTYSRPPRWRSWVAGPIDSTRIDPALLDPTRVGTDARLLAGNNRVVLRRLPRPATLVRAIANKAAHADSTLDAVMLESGEGDTIPCPDGSVLVLRWLERAFTIHSVSGAGSTSR